MKTTELAKKLKELRALRGMSQEYLADESKVSLRTIQRIENNESEPTGETIKRIANALDVELSELIGTNIISETNDLKSTIIFLKKKLSKTNNKSEIKVFNKFIELLQKLKEKDLNTEQMESIVSYIKYLELDKIPSFNNEIFKHKLAKLKKHLKNKLRFVPNNYYTTRIASFGLSFAFGFAIQKNINYSIKTVVILVAILLIGIGIILDKKIKKEQRSFSF